ncbi:hypothetical protein [Streptomyces fulvoviolaceus]|uniref:hypothetical protein n=1 Tax=Streptomyces fulvoviolaceus TaxID=285535 RepID=UPI0004CACE3D|nr:hypothetical protein [Streptomyces fulvoviolaceus]
MKNLLRRTCLALTLGLGVSLAAPGLSTAAQDASGSETGAAACPVSGQRVKTATSSAVFLVGPSNRLYWITNEATYFRLWDSWNGIATVPDSALSCWEDSYPLTYSLLAKTSTSPRVYIWDDSYDDYRWITSEAVFNKYGFSWSKIITSSSVPAYGPNWSS